MSIITARSYHLDDGAQIILRCAEESDAAALFAYTKEVFRDGTGLVTLADEFVSDESRERERIIRYRDTNGFLFLLAEHEGDVVGILDFKVEKKKMLAHAGEFGVSVRPEWRGRGAGSILLSTLIAWATEQPSIEKINLRVLSNNDRAISMYKRFGFTEEGRMVRAVKYPDGTYMDSIWMTLFV